MTKVFIVSETDFDDYAQHGIFSTREAAEAYVAMVTTAEITAKVPVNRRSYLNVDEYVVDELVNHFPVYSAKAYRRPRAHGAREERGLHLLTEVTATEAHATPPYAIDSITAYGRTPQAATAKLQAARAQFFGEAR